MPPKLRRKTQGDPNRPLTLLQERFVHEYLVDGNATGRRV